MKYLFWLFLAVFTLVALSSLGHFFFSKDKYSQKRIRSFVKTKGILYFFLAIGAIIYEIFTLNNYSPTVVLTIYIAVFETVQNIAQARAEEYQEKVQQALENHANKNDHTLKNIEKIFVFCTEVLEPLKHGHKTEDNIKLAYEQIYDYLKYYSCADQFFNVFDDYINNLCSIDDVDKALCAWKTEFECSVTKIVKVPE